MNTKICTKCGQEKKLDDFYIHRRAKDGLNSWCKTCNNKSAYVAGLKYLERNKAKHASFDYSVERMLRCCKCNQLKSSRMFFQDSGRKSGYVPACKTCIAHRRRKNIYGITPEAVYVLIKRQENKCAVCGTIFAEDFHVDHSHITNEVRGLLCSNCNTALGLLKDSPAILRSAASYLERSPPSQ